MRNVTPKKFSFSESELRQIFRAWLAITFAFSIMMGISGNIISSFLISGLTIGVAFIFHELAHKFVAIKNRCDAEFRSNDSMLLLMIVLSFFGVLFAAPGAVSISGHVTKKNYGLIALAGPLTNILLALFIFPLLLLGLDGFFGSILLFGFIINSWLALFNMIPFFGFDGQKIFSWNKTVYYSAVGASMILVVLSQNLDFLI